MGAHIATISTKGQLVLPKALRDRLKWAPGTRVMLEESGNGVMMRLEPQYSRTTMAEVYGILKYDGPPRTIEDMDAGVLEEAAESHRRSVERD